MAGSAAWIGAELELVPGALLAEVAGRLSAEGGVLGSQVGDFLAGGVEVGAERC